MLREKTLRRIDDAVDVPEIKAAVCSAEDFEGAVAVVEDSTDDGVEFEADANVPKDNPVAILRARMLWKIPRPRSQIVAEYFEGKAVAEDSQGEANAGDPANNDGAEDLRDVAEDP